MNHVIQSQMLDFGDVREMEVQQLLKDENRENSHASVEKQAPLQFHNATVMNQETLVTNALQSSGSGVLVSGASNSTFLNESSVLDQSLSPLLSESAILEPLHLPESLNGFQLDKLREEIESRESQFGSASVQDNGSVHLQEEIVSKFKVNGHSVAELHEDETDKRRLGEEGEMTSYNFLLGESVRKELHMFYDENKSDEKGIGKINGYNSLSPIASAPNSKTVSASLRDTIVKGGEVTALVPPLKAGNATEPKYLISSFFMVLSRVRRKRGPKKRRRKEKKDTFSSLCCVSLLAVSYFFSFPIMLILYEERLFIQIIMNQKYLFQVIKKALFIVEKTQDRAEDIQET